MGTSTAGSPGRLCCCGCCASCRGAHWPWKPCSSAQAVACRRGTGHTFIDRGAQACRLSATAHPLISALTPSHPTPFPPLSPPPGLPVQPGLLPVPSQLFQGSLLLGGLAKLGLGSGEPPLCRAMLCMLWHAADRCAGVLLERLTPWPCGVACRPWGSPADGDASLANWFQIAASHNRPPSVAAWFPE